MNMKITTAIAFGGALAAASVALTACSNPDRQLHRIVEQAAAECPMRITDDLTLQSVSATDDGYVEYRYVFTNKVTDPRDAWRKYGEQAVRESSLRMLRADEASRPFFNALVESGRGLKYVYVTNAGRDTCELVIGPADVERVAAEAQADTAAVR